MTAPQQPTTQPAEATMFICDYCGHRTRDRETVCSDCGKFCESRPDVLAWMRRAEAAEKERDMHLAACADVQHLMFVARAQVAALRSRVAELEQEIQARNEDEAGESL